MLKFKAVALALLAAIFLPNFALADATIAPAGEGNAAVLVDGKNVWPPKGPACENYVNCCKEAGKLESSVSLMCQLSVSQSPVDCGKSLQEVKQYLKERNLNAPAACLSPAKP